MRWPCLLLLSACVKPSAVECGDGRVCPQGKVCATVTNPDELLCVTPDQVDSCAGMEPFAPCLTDGRCYDGVCLTAGCGNARTDPDEDCDDGNAVVGDGCTPTCHTEECGNGFVDPVQGELCDDGNLVGHDGCNSTCSPEQLRWEQVSPNPQGFVEPDVRWDMAMTYDVARGRVLLFGGKRGDPSAPVWDNETWEWGKHGWIQRFPAVSPRPRSGAALAYDAKRRRAVLFGGGVDDINNITNYNDTWEWDGTQWTQILPVGPVPSERAGHAMTYDPVRERVVLVGGERFNGFTVSDYNDTWTWDGTQWEQLATTGATIDDGGFGSIAYDPVHNTILYGGPTGSVNGPTYSLSGTTWTQVATTGMYPRSTMAYDIVAQRMVAFGGEALNGSTTSIRAFDGSAWTNVGTITTREDLACAGDVDRGAILVFGGRSSAGVVYNDTLEWKDNALSTAATPSPISDRAGVGMANDLLRGVVTMQGGEASDNSFVNNTVELGGEGWIRRPIAGAPTTERLEHGLAYDSAHHELVIFGGLSLSGLLADTWVHDGVNPWTERLPAMSPTARSAFGMTYDAARSRVVLFGGELASGDYAGDTWEWDGTTWAQVATTGPPGRIYAQMTYDPIRRVTVLAGGTIKTVQDGQTTASDTWVWDGVTWKDVTPASRPSKTRGSMAWDPTRRRAVLFGGLPFDETIWSWDGAVWTADAPQGPLPRSNDAMASDPSGAGVIMFGGRGSTSFVTFKDTWRLRELSDAAPYESCKEVVDLDGDKLAGCADPDCWAVCAPLCPPGVTCDAAAPHCGDGTCNTTLETHRMCPEDCTATPARCGDFLCDAPETAATCPGDCP